MLLRGLRLEGDCFRSDKNHLAPSEEPASQHRTGQHRIEQHIAELRSMALAPRQCTQAGEEDEPHVGLRQYQTLLLNHQANRFQTLFSEGKRVNTENK